MGRSLTDMSKGILIAMVSLTLTLACVEGVLRAARINNLSSIAMLPGKGVIRVPGAPYVWRKEGFSQGRFNSHGFRDRPRTWEKSPGTYRIIVLGDSYTEALQVPLEKSFPGLMEEALNRTCKTRFEVLNLGQSGFGTTDEYLRWKNFGVQYDPDLVVVAFYPGNDIRNNSSTLNTESFSCYFRLGPGDDLRLDCSQAEEYFASKGLIRDAWQSLKRHSYLASFLSERLYLVRMQTWKRDRQARSREDQGLVANGGLDPFDDVNVYLEDPPPAWKEAYRLTRAVMSKFANEVRSQGKEFLLVTISTPMQIDERARPRGLAKSVDWDLPERAVAESMEAEGVPTLRLGSVFRSVWEREKRTLHGTTDVNLGHWNERGHELAAEWILRYLVQRRVIPTSDCDSTLLQSPESVAR